MKLFYATLVFFLSITCTAQTKEYKLVKFPANNSSKLDVVYTQINGWDGRIDLYFDTTSIKPKPIIINIHGGGWNHGVKESQTGFGSFFKNGFAVANVEYRLESVAPAPAAVQDLRCALTYVYNNAKELNIDTNKIVLMGGSAGGHLALLTGMLGDSKFFDTNCPSNHSLKVAAIIDKYGPTDLTQLLNYSSAKKWLRDFKDSIPLIQSVSPLYYVAENSPPIFIIHGTKDPIIPYQQSEDLYKALIYKGVKTKLITIENGGHGKFSKAENAVFKKELWQFLSELNLLAK